MNMLFSKLPQQQKYSAETLWRKKIFFINKGVDI